MLGSEDDVETARADLKAAEADVAKWGEKPADCDYNNLLHRVQWARARLDAAGER